MGHGDEAVAAPGRGCRWTVVSSDQLGELGDERPEVTWSRKRQLAVEREGGESLIGGRRRSHERANVVDGASRGRRQVVRSESIGRIRCRAVVEQERIDQQALGRGLEEPFGEAPARPFFDQPHQSEALEFP